MFNVTFISFVLHRQREPFHKYHPEQQDCLDLHLPIKNMQCSFGNRFEGIICPPRKRPRQGQGKLNFTPVQILNVCFNEYINFKIGNLDIKKNYIINLVDDAVPWVTWNIIESVLIKYKCPFFINYVSRQTLITLIL